MLESKKGDSETGQKSLPIKHPSGEDDYGGVHARCKQLSLDLA